MIRCNLAIILAERNLKITKVCKDTGISRTTLTYLANNYSKGIQYDTLDALCTYLRISPNDLISHIPITINLTSFELFPKDATIDIHLDIKQNNILQHCSLFGEIQFFYPDEQSVTPHCADVTISLYDDCDDKDIAEENEFIITALKKLPRPFISDLEKEIISHIDSNIEDKFPFVNGLEDFSYSIYWRGIF